ncbi:hypothetical protein E4G67_04725 [Candidatus Bathyarchaeota archaeon]|nr:MAG: hypothetical protein E4G67_04725 [Candidatus Bathyarchaeota archaeon]
MSASFIPPKDPNEDRLNRIKTTLSEVLRPYITGKNKDEKLVEVVDKSISAIRPLLKLLKDPTQGATVMTEGASRNAHGFIAKGPTNL